MYSNYLSQPLQYDTVACFGISSVMSTFDLIQGTQVLAGLGSIKVPHWQHNLNQHQNNHITANSL